MIPGLLASEVSAALREFPQGRFRDLHCPFRGGGGAGFNESARTKMLKMTQLYRCE